MIKGQDSKELEKNMKAASFLTAIEMILIFYEPDVWYLISETYTRDPLSSC